MSKEETISIRLAWRNPSTNQSEEQVFALPLTIGRSESANLLIDHPQLSGHHALINGTTQIVTIKDQESTNGVFVNGKKVTHSNLQNGDSFRLGSLEFNVAIGDLSGPKSLLVEYVDPITNQLNKKSLRLPIKIGRQPSNSLVLDDPSISRSHAIIQNDDGLIKIIPTSQTQKTFVNNQEVVQQEVIRPGMEDVILLGSTELKIYPADLTKPASVSSVPNNKTIIFSPDDDSLRPASEIQASSHKFPPTWFKDQSVVSVDQLRTSQYQVEETVYLSIGGGLGSFIWVDNLLIYGVPKAHIMSIGFEPKPYGRYQRLCQNSQIPGRERLRSNSDSTPDNIWGWPGYAVREIWSSFWKGDLKNASKVTWQIFTEPTFYETYTPISQNVFDSIDREARRIDWSQIWQRGSVRAIRKTNDGRYAIAYAQKTNKSGGSTYKFVLAHQLHLSVGYPGIKLLPNLQEYRQRTGDFRKIVNAYEPHNHVYDNLTRSGGVVVVRGRGIVASRIIQRLYELRQTGANIRVVHLMRRPLPEGNSYLQAKRDVNNHWEFQPFNWPKAAWGGDLRVLLEEAPPGERARLISAKVWGGTTTADRKDWQEIVSGGLAEGWYKIEFAEISRVDPNDKTLSVQLDSKSTGSKTELEADFVVDATGLESGIRDHPLLEDLLDMYQVKQNVQKRLEVSNDFELLDMKHGSSRMYASGVITLGGPYAPVDSFLGLQYSAQRSVEHMVKNKTPGLKRMNMFRSYLQWLKWVQGATP